MFGIPGSFAYLLYKKTKAGVIETPDFQYRWGMTRISCFRLRNHLSWITDVTDVVKWIGSLTLPYRQQYYWWELMNQLRKCLIVIVINFFSNADLKFVQLNIAMVVLLAFLILQVFHMSLLSDILP
jgi:hypothetical protein